MDEIIKQMPKVILHIHLDGSLRPESVRKWLQEQGMTQSIEEVKRQLTVSKDCRNLNEYLEKFDLPVRVLQKSENIKVATYELLEDLSKQGVIYAEIRFAPTKHMNEGLSCDEVVSAAIEGLEKAKRNFSIGSSLILCCMRGDTTSQNMQIVNSARRFLNRGVCAIDLAGAEALFPTRDYEDIFSEANKLQIPFTIHAGEAAGPESIKDALKFGAKRIGHGVRCIENKKLVEMLKNSKIPLEICPTSNLQTQAVKGKHPLEKLYKSGLMITISTDDDTVSNTNIIKEYEWILQNTELTYNDLIQMNINAAQFAFTTSEKKSEMIERIVNFKDRQNKNYND